MKAYIYELVSLCFPPGITKVLCNAMQTKIIFARQIKSLILYGFWHQGLNFDNNKRAVPFLPAVRMKIAAVLSATQKILNT